MALSFLRFGGESTLPPQAANASRWAAEHILPKEENRRINMNNTTDQQSPVVMSKSIAVFGAGPGLGQAVARRYAREGYTVVLVARRPEPLDLLAKDLISAGATAHVITADLSHTNATPRLAEQIHDKVGNLDAFYYAPTPDGGFIPAANLTPQHAQDFMPLSFYTLLALVQEFLPHMLKQGDGAILTAQGASSVQGLPNMSGPGPAQAAQRNYLQSLHTEVAEKGIYVGMLYIGVAIENSAFHTEMEKAKAAGEPVWEMPTVDPAHLADLLWTMHSTKGQPEVTYPEILFNH
jgi:short-subunit dehydrogenase